MPGGQASAFCEPVSMTCTPSFSISNSSAMKELMASTTRKTPFSRQKRLISSMS